ncbi:MAG: hypothetical protein TYPL_4280 [Candidatus Tyloplasma litorale]|nr:MAG: hypothetical protein TYPL_4280 [Mycoplasmatales bacterium]
MDKAIMKESRTSKEGGSIKNFFSKLSRGLMLPIALLPMAGLLLGIGAGMENVIAQIMNPDFLDLNDPDNLDLANQITQASFVFGVISSIGDVVFANLPTLFCLGVAIAFAEEAGVAVFSALVGWIIFNATQSTMIWENGDNYHIFWYESVPASVVTSNVGITSMQTSVFGGITIGLFVAYIYNKFHTFQMPKVLGFFSGTRSVPIIVLLLTPMVGIFFLMIWPLFGIGLDKLGAALVSLPIGINALIFGLIERSLIPFGLHHAFYTPLWYTSAGGILTTYVEGANYGEILGQGDQGVWFEMQTLGIPFSILPGVVGGGEIQMGANTWSIATNLDGSYFEENGMWTILNNGSPVYEITANMNPGEYMQGKFTFMIFGLPAAGAAMVMAAKKENREVAMSVIGAAALTSFLTGITEPIEFTFLFLAPFLYYGFHVWMAGLSFWVLQLLGTHIGMTFSGGIFDMILFGIIPQATGFGSNFFWVIPLGIIYMPIYYFVFYFYITRKDIKTPGRDESAEVKLVSRADYDAAKEAKKTGTKTTTTNQAKKTDGKSAAFNSRLMALEKAVGGVENLSVISACASRLRLIVIDPKKVDVDALKSPAVGAYGNIFKGASLHVIFGGEADIFKSALIKMRAEKKGQQNQQDQQKNS